MGKIYILHEDPGHAWLEVPINEALDLGVKPSRGSYQKGSNWYLEEDCDMPAFMRAYELKYGHEPRYEERSINEEHPIRRYAHIGG